MPIVINADDFGLSGQVNQAIVGAFRAGWISSATAMANMPGIGEAADLVRSERLAGRVGVHLNLTQGEPLTARIRGEATLCGADGRFHARPRQLFRLTPDERRAVADELRAQVLACRKLGFEPSHLDSHHHVHTSWDTGTIVIAIATELGVRMIRPAHNAGHLISVRHRMYSAVFNRRLASRRLLGVRRFCSLGSATPELLDQFAAEGIEVMAHPALTADGRITDFETGPELGAVVPALLRGRPIASYGDLQGA
jgi:hypothetical protein